MGCDNNDCDSGAFASYGYRPEEVAISLGLAIYARMVRLSHNSNQTVGEKSDFYVTLRQLEEAFIQMRDEVMG